MAGVLGSIVADMRDGLPKYLDHQAYLQLRKVLDRLVGEERVKKVPAFNPLHPSGSKKNGIWISKQEKSIVYCL